MKKVDDSGTNILHEHISEIRVRYFETDGMGFLHHANYATYFEAGRVEALRSLNCEYRDVEARGYLFVMVDLRCRYRQPARFDDLVAVHTRLVRLTPARMEHDYVLKVGDRVIAEAHSLMACVDQDGKLQKITADVFPPEIMKFLT